jgi:hypothetical protein
MEYRTHAVSDVGRDSVSGMKFRAESAEESAMAYCAGHCDGVWGLGLWRSPERSIESMMESVVVSGGASGTVSGGVYTRKLRGGDWKRLGMRLG